MQVPNEALRIIRFYHDLAAVRSSRVVELEAQVARLEGIINQLGASHLLPAASDPFVSALHDEADTKEDPPAQASLSSFASFTNAEHAQAGGDVDMHDVVDVDALEEAPDVSPSSSLLGRRSAPRSSLSVLFRQSKARKSPRRYAKTALRALHQADVRIEALQRQRACGRHGRRRVRFGRLAATGSRPQGATLRLPMAVLNHHRRLRVLRLAGRAAVSGPGSVYIRSCSSARLNPPSSKVSISLTRTLSQCNISHIIASLTPCRLSMVLTASRSIEGRKGA
jgi:hypothetical protein